MDEKVRTKMAYRTSFQMGDMSASNLLNAAWQTRLAIFLSQNFSMVETGSAPVARAANPLSAFRRRAWVDNLLAASLMDWRVDPADPRKLWRDVHGEPIQIEHRGRQRMLCAHPYRFGVNLPDDRVFNPAAEILREGEWDAFAVLKQRAEQLGIELVRNEQGYVAARGDLSATAKFSEVDERHCACLALTRLIALGALDAHRAGAQARQNKKKRRH